MHKEYYTQFVKENYKHAVHIKPLNSNDPNTIFLFKDATRTVLNTKDEQVQYVFLLLLIYRH
ncbi:hypothetical protein vBEcoMphAPEC6_00025 [Escherichia phage ph0011]|nr:hypothetical protein vBEcoMphAPEC6_00025 [Escherichia phage ph0011]